MKKIDPYFILILLLNSCIDKVELKEASIPKKLVVDGSITNLPGPYFVTLTYSEPFNSKKITTLISGAEVKVVDNLGNEYPMKAFTNGTYRSDSATFRGVVGRSYFIDIKTPDGKQFRSKPETILPPVPVDSVLSKYVASQAVVQSFDVAVQVKDPANTRNYYRWKWRNYDTIDYCLISRVKNDLGSFVYKSPCCGKCWEITTSTGTLAMFSDDLSNGKTFTQKVANIPYDGTHDYYMQIEQYSVSKENYNYWNLVQGQISNTGGIFDNTPAFIQGNVYNVKDTTEQVLGTFNVMGATKKIQYIRRQVPGIAPYTPAPLTDILIITNDCYRCGGDTRTPVKPEGWRG